MENGIVGRTIRNAVSKPLSKFLPEKLIEALPLSYNWERVTNAIVFVADGNLEQFRAHYKKKCKGKVKLSDHADFEAAHGNMELTISAPDIGFLEVFAVDENDETADGFVRFYGCANMDQLRRKHPTKIFGIVIES